MIYLTGDTHGIKGLQRFYAKNWKEGRALTKSDYLVILGDFGIPWTCNNIDKYWLQWLAEQPWTTLVIDGNHDNFKYLESLPVDTWCGGHVHKINDSIYHLIRGEVFTIEGNTILAAGGATSVDKDFRIPYVNWWPEEVWSKADEKKIQAASQNNKIDYVFAHTAPEKILDRCFGDTPRYNDPVSKTMSRLKIKFNKKWYFGHLHVNKMLDDKYVCLYGKIVKLGKY